MTDHLKMRLAVRVEGTWWVAYCAEATTMAGAVEIGRIRMALAAEPACKQGFLTLMQAAMAGIITNMGAHVQGWNDPTSAPEHERSGRA